MSQNSHDSSETPQQLVHERVSHELLARDLEVAAITQLTPRMIRVTFSGDSLASFKSLGPADHVKAFFPDPETGEYHAPRMTDAGMERPERGKAISRDYTPLPREDGQLDLDFLLHGDEGPASYWASRAQVGDRLVVAGPRGSRIPPQGANWYVLVGDETALPAISRWLQHIGPDGNVTIFVEVDGPEDENYPIPYGYAVTWLHRNGATAGTSDVLDAAVRGIDIPTDTPGFVWGAGEAGSLKPIRRHIRRELGLDKTWQNFQGYWKIGIAEHDHHAPVDPEDPED